ncbi:uncharacterized protein PGTG_11668 [Puccinia graminis f. sp. tritici CRL 75-36-700-3]|uniref:NuA4 histone acetyltransferase subunit n=1 Tax=Puccinia graminis f. sp. tritici (strain CRL 75-36-700-3 / race SCCL) TaxID=418459 RepID=E3KNN7_PUCGT|nr:uncharacterized protein PGTG_11668 [Puccinia graminis f. sp. tritici CRL 75-36-700-3]EFP85912.1 hypothetical protein PGTG_11668 [Puccinia graminis f. sp. tritici CRL 75-36-700-3]
MPTYGGDEVSAVVLDIGSSTTRAGYAGEDTPKVVIPTSYGYIPPASDSAEPGAGSYYFGDHGPTLWRAQMEVRSPMKESMVEDWTAVGKLITTVFDREMRLGLPAAVLEPDEKRGILTEHPLLVTEPSWNSKENRERMIEMAFEELDTPAYYSVDRSVMAAFAAGKGTAVVVDIGDDLTTVTPICDGFVLRKGIQKSPIAGNVLSSLLLSTTESLLPTPLYPHSLIASKASHPAPVDPDSAMASATDEDPVLVPPGVTLRDERLPGKENSKTTDSFLRYQKIRIMHDLKESICEVFPRTWEEETLSAMPGRTFEFPSGQQQQYGRERYMIPEVIFNPAISPWPLGKHVGGRHPGSTISMAEAPLPLSHLLLEAIAASDIDIQPTLNANIILTGASSLIPGLIDRLDFDLKAISPAVKFKISAPGNLVERKFAPWLGGSILASLGSFHQLWIGKDEYKEQGRSVVHRRCK